MKIYISHSTNFDYIHELYQPLLSSGISKQHRLILPHLKKIEPHLIKNELKTIDLVIAEASLPSTGQGIELGWANNAGVRILVITKKNVIPSASLKTITSEFIKYKDAQDLITKLELYLSHFTK